MRSSRVVLLFVVGVIGIAALLGACGSGGASTATFAGVVRTPPLAVAGVTLPRADDGGPFTMQAPTGQAMLVYFGYTSCPDVCPTTMSDISVALGELPDELAQRVTVAMVTVDPERDSPEVLSGYLDYFFDRSEPLRTEDPAALKQAADAFGVRFDVEDHDAGDTYEVAHSAITYVVDDTGTVVVEWPFGFDSVDMAGDLTHLLDEEQRS